MLPCVKCKAPAPPEPFLGLSFRPLESADRALLDVFLKNHPHPLSGYTLGSLLAWDPVFRYRYDFPEPETLLISFCLPKEDRCNLLQPVGAFTEKTREALLRAGSSLPYPLRIVGVGSVFIKAFPEWVARFEVKPDRDNDNYIYRAADLALLAGRRYSKKRNLIAQATQAYEWTVEPLALSNTDACLEVLRGAGLNLELDGLALENSLRLFPEIPQDGVLLRVNGKPAAFSIFEPQTKDIAVVHFERALRSYKGLYQVLNRATAQAMLERDFGFINREEDLGDPGLRQSKKSYYPVRMEEAFVLTFKA